MPINGVKPVKRDHRDRSATRTLGASSIAVFPNSFSVDNSFGFPDQDADGLPEGCTGYAQANVCADEDGVQYVPKYTYDQTLAMEGSKEGVGCDIRDSLKSTILYGVSKDGVNGGNNRAAYYVIEQNAGLDWFDSLRNILYANRSGNRSISMASPWFSQWSGSAVGPSGIVVAPPSYTWNFGHNWKACGWTTIGGVPYIVGKTWQGPDFGDHGYCYFSREIINALMKVNGSGAFLLFREDPANPEDVKLVKLNWLDYFGSYIRYLLGKL